MRDILPKYGLNFEKIEEENVLKEYLKKGIKCLASFYYNEKNGIILVNILMMIQ